MFEREVSNFKDAVLLLWLVHNKANKRLSGDISEDPVYPKETFPQREFCSSCYDNTVGGQFERILLIDPYSGNAMQCNVNFQDPICGLSLTRMKSISFLRICTAEKS